MVKIMSKISVGDFKEFYLQQSKPRSIRRLHKILKDKYPRRKLVSLATIFRHSNSENWKSACEVLDSRVSEKILEKNVNKKVNEFEKATTQLELASQKSLELLLDKLKSITITDKVADLVGLNKIAVESIKMKNVLEGQPANLTGHIQYDSEDVVKLKQHIQELYQSINVDLVNRAEQKKIDNKKLN